MKRFYLLFKGCISFSFPTYKTEHTMWSNNRRQLVLVLGNASGPVINLSF